MTSIVSGKWGKSAFVASLFCFAGAVSGAEPSIRVIPGEYHVQPANSGCKSNRSRIHRSGPATPGRGADAAFEPSSGSAASPNPLESEVDPTSAVSSALILYDSASNDDYSKAGLVYATMIRSLLGHFPISATLHGVESYVTGELADYAMVFYVGAIPNNPLPSVFLSDVLATQKTVVWLRDNISQLAWNPAYDFTKKFGIIFNGMASLNFAPTPQNPKPGFYDTVQYKNVAMPKFYAYEAESGVVQADPSAGIMQVADPSKVVVYANIRNSSTGQVAPYAMRSGNFWYFADLPLSYIGPRDRYLAFTDLLHDITGIDHPVSHRAMVRLEDMGADITPGNLAQIADFLSENSIPFSMAAIPFYRDPLGWNTEGTPVETHLKDAKSLLEALRYGVSKGGSIVMHGYTHQWGDRKNKNTGVSADDYEFWDAVFDRPVDGDSADWVSKRLNLGISELAASGFTPFAWEPPHYQASPLDYVTFPSIFKNTYQRVVYYTSMNPDLDPSKPSRDVSAGMFFPYVIEKDAYGQRVLPENLGNIEYDISSIDPFSSESYTWQDLYQNAQYGLVVRDGFASFFFHPFWLEIKEANALQDFKSLVNGISGLGYSWVGASSL